MLLRWVLLSIHLRLTRTHPSCCRNLQHTRPVAAVVTYRLVFGTTKAEASVVTGFLLATYSVAAAANFLPYSGDVVPRGRRSGLANCASSRPYDAHSRSENARWTGCAVGSTVAPRCRRRLVFHRVELLLVIADCIPLLLRFFHATRAVARGSSPDHARGCLWLLVSWLR